MQPQEPGRLSTERQANRQACTFMAVVALGLCVLVSLLGALVWRVASPMLPAIATQLAQLPAPTVTPRPTPTAGPTSTPLAGYVPHRIAVRVVDGVAEFYDRVTGETFVPRGYNYNRMSPILGTSGQLWEETLNPGFYDPASAEAALQKMQADGYNVVRVVMDCCRPSSNVGAQDQAISAAYIDNVMDFLNKAKSHEIFVLLVLHLTPADGPYNQLWDSIPAGYGGANLRYLTRGGFASKAWYDQDFIRVLIKREAPLDAVFAYDLTNDVGYDMDQPPLNMRSGTITPVNGETYDMSRPEDRKKMMEDHLVYWIDEQRAAILEVDPTALVTASFLFFDPDGPYAAFWRSTEDFVDMHLLLGAPGTMRDIARQFPPAIQRELNGPTQKPVIIGKLAAAQSGFPSAASAAQALLKWQASSCQYGVVGWLLTEEYTWIYSPFSDGGIINDTLAPVNRPDPCSTR